MDNLLNIRDLCVDYGDSPVLRGISMSVKSGQIIGVVGESGSGKTTSIYSVLGILGKEGRITSGKIEYRGRDIINIGYNEKRGLRGAEISLISQSPIEAFNPVKKIKSELKELVDAHNKITYKEAEEKMLASLSKIGLADGKRILDSYAFELSGGMCQRASIAMSMVLEPKILFADEPTSALDVIVQKQVIDELMSVRDEFGTSVVIVSHNIGVISYMADVVYVMYAGIIVEYGDKDSIIAGAMHPYTQNLISVVPRLNVGLSEGIRIEGEKNLKGCPYADSCPLKTEICNEKLPGFIKADRDHFVRCFNIKPDKEL